LRCYHLNVPELRDDFAELWPGPIEEWTKLPRGSVLLVDEAHNVFPKRSPHAKPPEWVAKLAEIRHFGIRMLIVTQDPRDLDSFVRRRVGVHYHVSRKTGHNYAVIHEFRPHSENPRDPRAQKTAQHQIWKYPKDLFGSYKSTTMHMVKPRLPWKFWLLPLLAIVAAYFVWKTYSHLTGMATVPDEVDLSGTAAPSMAQVVGLQQPQGEGERNPWRDAASFAEAHTPLLRGVPWSAPIYSSLQPTSVPELYCVIVGDTREWSGTCRCYSEQVTPIDMDNASCRKAARSGVYNPYRSIAHTQPQGHSPGDGAVATRPAKDPQASVPMPVEGFGQ
jgi:hypothetical protein